METKNIKLLELFMSFQGEGLNCGQMSTFIRFKDCNKNCSFCDTMMKMKYDPEALYSYEQIYEMGRKTNFNFTVTGGEPTLKKYREDIINLFKYMDIRYDSDNINRPTDYKLYIEFETNGFDIEGLIFNFYENNLLNNNLLMLNISPKYSDKEEVDKELDKIVNQLKVIMDQGFNFRYIFKLVAFDKKDGYSLTRYVIDKLINEYHFDKWNIFVMPEGTTKESLLIDNRQIQTLCYDYGVNFSSRLHILHNFN